MKFKTTLYVVYLYTEKNATEFMDDFTEFMDDFTEFMDDFTEFAT